MNEARIVTALGLLAAFAACDDDHAEGGVPWGGRTQVVAPSGSSTGWEASPACVLEAGTCEEERAACAGGVDIVVDREGKRLDSLCYPDAPTWTVEDLAAHDGNIEQRENNTVLVLDDADDGADVTGDVTIDANNVVLYGESAARAVLDGSLTVDGNHTLVRGIRITGDVSVLANNVTLAFCVIEGALTVRGNNVRLLGCDVLGSVTIPGNNARLYGNGVAGVLDVGKSAACVDNHRVVDGDADGVITTDERGAALDC
ncbi:MAG TPA: hypothetical protein VFX59_12695 [Polyangiales bacterium]|nr:hypothetical protein [Polyangiales bacterium]